MGPFTKGWRYRLRMRWAHRRGYCWPQKSGMESGHVWCHWCGMRGTKPPDVNDPVVRARLVAELAGQTAGQVSQQQPMTTFDFIRREVR